MYRYLIWKKKTGELELIDETQSFQDRIAWEENSLFRILADNTTEEKPKSLLKNIMTRAIRGQGQVFVLESELAHAEMLEELQTAPEIINQVAKRIW